MTARRTPKLKPHPVLGILPPLTKLEVERAIERVMVFGQTEVIEVADGAILHGLEEYEGCLGAGVDPDITRIKTPPDAIEYVMRRLPRHLTTLDRAVIAVLAEEEWKRRGRERMKEAGRVGGRSRGRDRASVPEPFGHVNWFDVAARVVGTTPGAVKRLGTLRRSAPDVFDAVRERRLLRLRDARDLAEALKTPDARAKVLELRKQHPGLPVARLVADVMRAERPPVAGSPAERGERWVVYEGPLAREGARIDDASIDLCHADIVYSDVAMAEEVAVLARRVLVEGGVLAMIAGHNVLSAMNAVAKHLTPVAVGAYHVKNNTRGRWTGPIVRVDSLPVLIFSKGRPRQITHVTYTSDTKDPTWHGWQKNVAATLDLIAAMAPAGARILDPCCGSATTGVAALQHGNSYFIGIDRDPAAVKTSRARLAAAERDLEGDQSRSQRKPRVA